MAQNRASTPADAFWTLDPFGLVNPDDPWHSDIDSRFKPARYGLVAQLTRRLTPGPSGPPYVHVDKQVANDENDAHLLLHSLVLNYDADPWWDVHPLVRLDERFGRAWQSLSALRTGSGPS